MDGGDDDDGLVDGDAVGDAPVPGPGILLGVVAAVVVVVVGEWALPLSLRP